VIKPIYLTIRQIFALHKTLIIVSLSLVESATESYICELLYFCTALNIYKPK